MSSDDVVILGVGNPLLDVVADVSLEYLNEYGLKQDSAYLVSPETKNIFKDLEARSDLKKILGGSAQNTIRAAQFLLKLRGSTAFLGCIGDDTFGEDAKNLLNSVGVNQLYSINKSEPTGTCATLIYDKKRCLIASIAAAQTFQLQDYLRPEVTRTLSTVRIVHAEGFFVTVSMETLLCLAHTCFTNPTKRFSLNLAAEWVVKSNLSCLLELIPYSDYIFCNEDECRCLARQLNWKEQIDTKEIASRMALFPKLDPTKPRHVIITQGHLPVIVAIAKPHMINKPDEDELIIPSVMGSGRYDDDLTISELYERAYLKEYEVKPIPKEELIDSNGCGDSFSGAFLAAIVKGKTIDESVNYGILLSQAVARRDGCHFPDDGSIEL